MSDVKPLLIAEDDPNDQLLLAEAFKRARIQHPIVVVENGEAAIRYMSTGDESHPPPCLLLTDLKMPKVNGFELLSWICQQERFRNMPVIVMSASGHESDVEQTLRLGARDYYVKPRDFRSLVELAKRVDSKWIRPHCGPRA